MRRPATAALGADNTSTQAATVASLAWTSENLSVGIEQLARRAGLQPQPLDLGSHGAVPPRAQDLDAWVDWAATKMGVRSAAIDATITDLPELLRGSGPALLRIEHTSTPRVLLILRSRLGRLRLLCPDLRVRSLPVATVATLLIEPHERPLRPEVDRLLEAAGVAERRRLKAAAALLRERLGTTKVARGWMLDLAPSAGMWRHLIRRHLPGRLAGALAVFTATFALEILCWRVMGGAAIGGRLDFGWLSAWALLLLSILPLRLAATWLDSTLSLDVSRIIKTRLLEGALRFDVDEARRLGVGQLLGRVMESQAFEALVLNSGLAAGVAVIELGFALWVLSLGAAGAAHVLLLIAWGTVASALAWLYFRQLSAWTVLRRDMTHALVERMVGHRTTLAQEPPDRRSAEDDTTLEGYLGESAAFDRAAIPFLVGVPSGWTLLGVLGLIPTFVNGSATPAGIAISVGGIVLARRALSGIVGGLANAASAVVAWRQIGPIYRAASTPTQAGVFFPADAMNASGDGSAVPLIDTHALVYRYRRDDEPAVNGARLTVHHGDRLLIEGPSGGGKSTLAALLAGLRTPTSGTVLLNGLDRFVLGDRWHRFATSAPQFQENHVLTGSLGFNLLLGRQWPASEDQLREAATLCEELGLGPLLRRMPSGLSQAVGETGWQLSHGERSRVFLARALLQDAPLTILDESFAALDPESLETCLATALRRARTLAVIAHP